MMTGSLEAVVMLFGKTNPELIFRRKCVSQIGNLVTSTSILVVPEIVT